MSKNDELEKSIAKFISKFRAAYPNQEPPSYEDVKAYIEERQSKNKHIVYPLAGLSWSQIEWQKSK